MIWVPRAQNFSDLGPQSSKILVIFGFKWRILVISFRIQGPRAPELSKILILTSKIDPQSPRSQRNTDLESQTWPPEPQTWQKYWFGCHPEPQDWQKYWFISPRAPEKRPRAPPEPQKSKKYWFWSEKYWSGPQTKLRAKRLNPKLLILTFSGNRPATPKTLNLKPYTSSLKFKP